METKDIIEIIAVLTSPIIAVGTTLWYQSRKEKRETKRKLFFNLITDRNSNTITKSYIDSLNSIDVVFYGDKKIRDCWRKYYESLIAQPFNSQNSAHLFLDLLSEIGFDLGYKDLKQSDIDRFYYPSGLAHEHLKKDELQNQLLRVLKSSQSFSSDMPPPVVINHYKED